MTNETAQGDDPAQNRGSDTQPGGGDTETRCVADGGQPDDTGDDTPSTDPPEVSVGDRVTVIMRNDAGPEYVKGVVVTVHAPRTIDAVYRVESRAQHGGDGSFERDHHTDRYEFQTSLVYMADIAGWRKGWDDA